MFKQIFWDCDGVLVDTEPAFFKSTKNVLAKVGHELTLDWWINVHLATGKSVFDILRDEGMSDEQINRLREDRNVLYHLSLSQEGVVMEGIQDILKTLLGKVPMSVVTSSLRVNNDKIMDARDLRKYFDFIIAREDFEKDKPAPDCYLKAWERSSVPRENCLVIEDTQRGVQAAKSAGLTCFALPNEYTSKHDFSMADRVLKNSVELLDSF